MSSLIKIRPLETDLFRADGQIYGHVDTNSRFSQFCERS